ncbi:hypothetical protein [Nocardia sp. NPDC046763]|uniref:hypothetical protein n=1 Tax=Nocardia sp. NPDC046763 TaxID=3155256 RepID=UPI0034056D58
MNTGTDPSGLSFINHMSAADQAEVGQQIGAQINDSVLHGTTNIYTTASGDSPERLHEVARAHLDGGNPRRAEEILRDLLENGHHTGERCHLYVLAVVSERSFSEIDAEPTTRIGNAMRMAADRPRDGWRDALDVVDKLLRYAHTGSTRGAAVGELAAAMTRFSKLASDRRDEIDRHLALILSGTVHEQLNSERAQEVARTRMDNRRAARAWMFFEADPLAPIPWSPPPRLTIVDWPAAILGSVALVMAVVSILRTGITAATVGAVVLIVIGAGMVLRCVVVWQTHTQHTRSARSRPPLAPNQQPTPLDAMIDRCFRRGDSSGLWDLTAAYRHDLKHRLGEQYGDDDTIPSRLKWLIDWHATRFGRLHYYLLPQTPVAARAENLRDIGVLAWVSVLVMVTISGHITAAALAAVGWTAIFGVGRIASRPRARELLDQDAQILFSEEQAMFRRRSGALLAERPTDQQMARWLALDKTYLKDEALRRANLQESDLVTYVVLTARAPFARGGRVEGGPPRYEAYMVTVLLLTRFGMRTTRTYLNLATGNLHNEQRRMCTYDAVASASVTERLVRGFRSDGHPQSDLLDGRVFQLTLLNGTHIAEVEEYLRTSPNDPARTSPSLSSAQISGFDTALHILEAVATEGRDWITRDHERKQRWARNWCTNPPPRPRADHTARAKVR